MQRLPVSCLPRLCSLPNVMRFSMFALDMHDELCVCCCAGAFSSGAGQQGGAVPGSSKPRFADSKGLGKSMSKALAQADAGEGPLSAHSPDLLYRLPMVHEEVVSTRWHSALFCCCPAVRAEVSAAAQPPSEAGAPAEAEAQAGEACMYPGAPHSVCETHSCSCAI